MNLEYVLTTPKLTLSQTTNSKPFQTEEVADNNSKFDENGGKFSKLENKTLWEKQKLFIASNFSFSYSVSKRLVLQTHKKQRLFGKGLTLHYESKPKFSYPDRRSETKDEICPERGENIMAKRENAGFQSIKKDSFFPNSRGNKI